MYKCRYELWPIDSDVFDGLEHIYFLLHFQHLNRVAQCTHQTAA